MMALSLTLSGLSHVPRRVQHCRGASDGPRCDYESEGHLHATRRGLEMLAAGGGLDARRPVEAVYLGPNGEKAGREKRRGAAVATVAAKFLGRGYLRQPDRRWGCCGQTASRGPACGFDGRHLDGRMASGLRWRRNFQRRPGGAGRRRSRAHTAWPRSGLRGGSPC